jgi:hypothetical protein
MRLPIVLAALFGLAASLPSHANTPGEPDLAAIRAEQAELRAAAAAGTDPFASMSTGDRQALVDLQTRLLQLLDGRDSFDELMAARQMEVVNLLQEINAKVNDVGDDEKMRCEYVRTTGSNRRQRSCKTAAQRKIESEASLEALRRWRMKGHFHPDM